MLASKQMVRRAEHVFLNSDPLQDVNVDRLDT
jgi:hypothetical protein